MRPRRACPAWRRTTALRLAERLVPATTIAWLVRARAARRRSAAALVAISVAGTIVVVGSLFGVGVLTADQATRRALADLAPADRLVGVHVSTEDGANDAANDQLARSAMAPVLTLTDPLVQMTLYRPPRDPSSVLAIDDAKRWLELTGGRLPKPCDGGSACEAVRITPLALPSGVGEVGTSVDLAGVHLSIVGTAHPTAALPIDTANANGLIVLVDGSAGLHRGPGIGALPRTTTWFAPIDPERIHAWAIADLGSRIDDVRRALAAEGHGFLLATPEDTLAAVAARTEVAVARLVFVSSLVVGVLLAFAVFAAASERTDIGLEERRLRTAGAGRLGRLGFVTAEAIVPAVAGLVLGELVAAAVVAGLATTQGAPVDALLRLALVQPPAAGLALLLTALAVVAVALGIHPEAGRLVTPRIIATAAVPAVLVLAWDRISSGSEAAAPGGIGASATAPGTVLLPGLLGLVVILGSLVVLPPGFRRLARAAHGAPLALRLAAVSIARAPLRPAATTTLLAFSVGAVVFATVYAATLRQGATDQAAFLAGMDVRVQTLSAEGRFAVDVLPRLRAGAVGADVEVVPMVRQEGETATRRPFVLAGIDATAIPQLRGWRADFSSATPEQLAAAIAEPGDWAMPGQDIPPGTRSIDVEVDATGDPIRLSLVVEQADGGFRYLKMGDLVPGVQTFHVPLFEPGELATLAPADPTGWRIVAVLARNGGLNATDGPFSGNRQQADVTIRGLPGVVDAAASVHLDVSGDHSSQLVRSPARTDGLVLPAIVSPDLAADVGADGVLDVTVGSSLALRLKPVGVTSHFPTLVQLGDAGVVAVDLAPLLLAMNVHDPGTGVPNQILLRTPSDARTAEVVDALSKDPFPALVVQSRPALEAARANDPFAIGLVWGLAVGALAGLLLSIAGVVLATLGELRDEDGELWDLEAQGAVPASLGRLVVLRTALLCASGIVVGLVIGVGLGWLAAQAISEAGVGGPPIPPLLLVAPVVPIAGIGIGLLALLTLLVTGLARRHFAAPVGAVTR